MPEGSSSCRPKAATGNEEWNKEAGGTRGQTARLQIHSPGTPLPRVCCHQGGGTQVVEAEPSAACGSSMGVCLETAIVWEKRLLTWVCLLLQPLKPVWQHRGAGRCHGVIHSSVPVLPLMLLPAPHGNVGHQPLLPAQPSWAQSCWSLPIPDPPGAFWKMLTVGTPN